MNKFAAIVCIAAVATVSVGAITWAYNNRNGNPMEKTVVLNGETQTESTVRLTDMYPGFSTSYQIQLKGKSDERYALTVSFEKTGEVSLAPFVDVSLYYGGERIADGKLSEFLEGKGGSVDAEFSSSKTQQIEIVYSMSEEVGDEAQNTTADFKVVLTER